ncbi:MAG: hypothetical protein RJA44_1124 [Pseudomonadota bacterium]|jgi:flagellar biosynthesis protein FlhG
MQDRRQQPGRPTPADQADGLRRLFAGRTLRFVPVISNPFVNFGGVLIERLCSTLDDLGLTTLLVDASERGGVPNELASFDLAEGIELLSARVSYLAARGLPVQWVDSHGSTRAFLDAVAEAATGSEVVLIHGTALEMVRLFGRVGPGMPRPRPVLLCDDTVPAMTHAYAALKILAQRADWRSHDLMMCAPPDTVQARRVAERLGQCAEMFLGGVQRSWVQIDPAEPATVAPSPALQQLVRQMLDTAATHTLSDQSGHGTLRPVLPAPRLPLSA